VAAIFAVALGVVAVAARGLVASGWAGLTMVSLRCARGAQHTGLMMGSCGLPRGLHLGRKMG
jgi:hypothetical protein